MSFDKTSRNSSGPGALVERRAGESPRNPWQRLKGFFARPLRLEWRLGLPRLVAVDRRRSHGDTRLDRPSRWRSELAASMQAVGAREAKVALRHLMLVHGELGRRGWSGVESLPAPVLTKALAQAELLAGVQRSPATALIVERLRLLVVAAQLREERKARLASERAGAPEVSEATSEEFDEMERSWVGVVPAGMALVDEHKN